MKGLGDIVQVFIQGLQSLVSRQPTAPSHRAAHQHPGLRKEKLKGTATGNLETPQGSPRGQGAAPLGHSLRRSIWFWSRGPSQSQTWAPILVYLVADLLPLGLGHQQGSGEDEQEGSLPQLPQHPLPQQGFREQGGK